MTEPKQHKALVIYHSADWDGKCSKAVCEHFLKRTGAEVTSVGWNYGEPPPKVEGYDRIYIVDVSIDELLEDTSLNVVWIDHHKTAIEKHKDRVIKGLRIDGVAACRLAWIYFEANFDNEKSRHLARRVVAMGKEYFDRGYSNEPTVVRLLGMYDVWDHSDERVLPFQYGMRQWSNLPPGHWETLLSTYDVDQEESAFLVSNIIRDGRMLLQYEDNVNSIAVNSAYVAKYEGVTFLVCHTAVGNSRTFLKRDVTETGHDALMLVRFNGTHFMVSLYHAKHNTDIDLSEIAKRHGGGGHKGACGFMEIAKGPMPTGLVKLS